ncbi:MAG: glycoside hydrolase family 3 C-terminal domain-containing protein [Lachnospiraceae bacterium]|nr:glycoside hydrolase family 3 C-terminal domain-containing protein [Lachnospiraceae bacterium]
METQRNTPFWDVTLSVDQRIDYLLGELSLEEKIRLFAFGGEGVPRLGIPGTMVGGEAAHGVEARNDQMHKGDPDVTTSFPQPIGMSASFDPELLQKAGEVVGTEARVVAKRHGNLYGLSRWAPTVDIERDPRWGRNEEAYGEDPLLAGINASAYVRGMRGNDPFYIRCGATLKHFYANNVENGRGWKNSTVDLRNRNELYYEPFRRCIEDGGATGVMTAYNRINGIPGILNPEVRTVLKERFGLMHSVSDGGATALVANLHHYFGLHSETVAAAVKAGVDSMSDNPNMVMEATKEAVEFGLLSEADLDEVIRNVMRLKLHLGIYDYDGDRNLCPFDDVTEEDLCGPYSRQISEKLAEEAVVLLKNEGSLLPLRKEDAARILVAGPMADTWHPDWYGGTAPYRKSLLDGLQEVLGKEGFDQLSYTDGADYVTFSYGGKPVCVNEDHKVVLGDTPDVFRMEDWGEGNFTFRSVRTGKYLNSEFYDGDLGTLAAEKDQIFDWFVMERFELIRNSDGTVALENRFHIPVSAGENGTFKSFADPKVGGRSALKNGPGAAHFTMEVVKDGTEEMKKLAAQKEIIVLACGCCSMLNAKEEIDRTTLALHPTQQKLLDAATALGKKVVLVLLSNYPYTFEGRENQVQAMILSATGSQDMGTAMARTLFGENAPAGRCNQTWVADEKDLPDINDYDVIRGKRTYRYFDGKVLFPFGYGLTYSPFVYEDLKVSVLTQMPQGCLEHPEGCVVQNNADGKLCRWAVEKNAPGNANPALICVSVKVRNEGKLPSDEVVQIYASAPASRVEKPIKQLIAFRRLHDIQPGESRETVFCIAAQELRFFDVLRGSFVVEEGDYTIYAGRNCEDRTLCQVIHIPGEKLSARRMDKVPAEAFDDYVNMELTEGAFGKVAVSSLDPKKETVLVYGDCMFETVGNAAEDKEESKDPEAREEADHITILAKIPRDLTITAWIDGREAGHFSGQTGSLMSRMNDEEMAQFRENSLKEGDPQPESWPPVWERVTIPFDRPVSGVHELKLTFTGEAKILEIGV